MLYRFNCITYFYKILEKIKKEIYVFKCISLSPIATQHNIDNISERFNLLLSPD